jgi:hypothetical protein
VTRQKTLFPKPPPDDEELFTLEDDPAPPPQIDHTVLDVQLAIRVRDHLQFLTDDRLICGIPVKLGPNGPNYDLHLVKVFEWVGQPPQWQPTDDIVLAGHLLPEEGQS